MFSLRSRIMLTFSMIILTGTALMVTFINFSTRSGYASFVRENDIEITRTLGESLTEFYRIYGSWEGVEAVFPVPFQRSGQMRGMMGRPPAGGARSGGMFPQIILTDSRGRVLVNTDPASPVDQIKLDRDVLSMAQEISSGGRAVGFVLSGSMINRGLTDKEVRFLNRTNSIIIAVSLFILTASALFSWLFASRLSRPVSAMVSGAVKISAGDLSVRVPVEGRDELSGLSASFNKMAEALERNDLWRKQIIADSAHELRTPVSLIQGNLEMILDGVYEADVERIRSIYDETVVLARLIDELQQLSSAESGSMALNPEVLDLNGLIENVLNVFRAGEAKARISLNNYIDRRLPPVTGDYQKLKQVFANVLANAFRHTPEGGSIYIRAEVLGGSVLLSIEDTGSGIAEEDLEKIFERFYRTDSSRSRDHGGSGLGLAISREIIRLHGGKIYARAEEGRGAVIFISLPFKKQKS